MKITRQELLEILQKHGPTFQRHKEVYFADATYYLPSYKDVETMCINTYFNQYRYVVQSMDCDDFALLLTAFIVQERYRQMQLKQLTSEEYLPGAFGYTGGTKFKTSNGGHACNICVTNEKEVILIEPQGPGAPIWRPTNEDRPFFIRM